MTVADFKALLETTGVDPFEEIRFYDKDGNRQNVTVTQVGVTQSLLPAQASDPAHLDCKLEIPS